MICWYIVEFISLDPDFTDDDLRVIVLFLYWYDAT